jgi:excisionase family DNA binding protein
MPSDLLTVDQAAERLGISRTAVYKAINQKRLPVSRIGGWMLAVRIEDVDAYRVSQRRKRCGARRRTKRAEGMEDL